MRMSAHSFPLATMARASRRSRAVRDETIYEKRTWTLVALKAATRPTKEEARSADIVSVLGMTIESIARAGSRRETKPCGSLFTYRQGFRVLVYERPVVDSFVRASYPYPRRLDGVRGGTH